MAINDNDIKHATKTEIHKIMLIQNFLQKCTRTLEIILNLLNISIINTVKLVQNGNFLH